MLTDAFAVSYYWPPSQPLGSSFSLLPAVEYSYQRWQHRRQPHARRPTAVVIVLDWTRPWTFLEELRSWVTWIERWVQGERTRGHLRIASWTHIRHYAKPSAEPLLATSSALQGTMLPLGRGTFTHNITAYPPSSHASKRTQSTIGLTSSAPACLGWVVW
ncbi:hypothetical protein V8E53_001602 [Lactarius tabidus]